MGFIEDTRNVLELSDMTHDTDKHEDKRKCHNRQNKKKTNSQLTPDTQTKRKEKSGNSMYKI
jgi:hypothetical protein